MFKEYNKARQVSAAIGLQGLQQQPQTVQAQPYVAPFLRNNFRDNQASKEKETQIVYINSTGPEVMVTLPTLIHNFTDVSDFNQRDCFYFINKIKGNSMLNNVYSNSCFHFRVSDVSFYSAENFTELMVSETQHQLITSSTFDASSAIEIKLYKKSQGINEQAQSVQNTNGHYFTTPEIVSEIRKQIMRIVTRVGGAVYQPIPSSFQDFLNNFSVQELVIFEIFKATEIQYESSTGKIVFVTKNKNLRNMIPWNSLEYLTPTNPPQISNNWNAGDLILSNFRIEMMIPYEDPKQNAVPYRTARQLGMSLVPTNDYYYFSTQTDQQLKQIAYVNLFTADSEMYDLLPDNIKLYTDQDTFHMPYDQIWCRLSLPFPSNMFFTNSFFIYTSLNTNSWQQGGQKESKIASFQFERSGQETSTQELKNENRLLHQDVLDSLRNFRLQFFDEFGFPLQTNQEMEIEFVIQLKPNNMS